MTLFVDSCVRPNSRTRELAEYLLSRIEDNIETVKLDEISLPTLDDSGITLRNTACRLHDYSESVFDLPKQFARADRIVIAAPLWDLSFPALLKRYIEDVSVLGITFRYSEKGSPVSLCKAKDLYYITTSGGPVFNDTYGYGYVKEVATRFFGVERCRCISAKGLDVVGSDVSAILAEAKKEVDLLEI